MKSLFVVGCNPKEQYRIKSLLSKKYSVATNPSVHNSVGIVAKESFDMVLYDTDNVVPLELFLKEIRAQDVKTPVSAISGKIDLRKIQGLQSQGVVSIIKKPCTKEGLLRGIHKGFLRHEQLQRANEKTAPRYSLNSYEADILIGLRKHAIVSQISKLGMTLFLPASLSKGSKMLFSNPDLYEMVNLPYERPPRIEMLVESCTPLADYQFRVDVKFSEVSIDFQNYLSKYIDENAVSATVLSESKTILIADVDGFTRDFYKAVLIPKGYRLLFATNGFSVLDKLEEERVDMLILDLLLPKLSGQEVIAMMRKRKIQIPTIVATGENNPKIIQAMSTQVQGYLLKPFIGAVLNKRIASIFESWQASTKEKEAADTHITVHLETNLVVAFRDHVQLISISELGLEFTRGEPIAPGTTIFLKTDAILIQGQEEGPKIRSFELQVSRCEYQKNGQVFLVHAAFLTDEPAM